MEKRVLAVSADKPFFLRQRGLADPAGPIGDVGAGAIGFPCPLARVFCCVHSLGPAICHVALGKEGHGYRNSKSNILEQKRFN